MTAPATPAPADGAPGERVSVDAAAVANLQRMLNSWWANVGHDLGGPQTAELYAALRTIDATAAPFPAPASAAGVGAETLAEWRALVGEAFVACKAETTDRETLASMLGAHGAALRAACDALSTAAAPVRPDRAAVEAAVDALQESSWSVGYNARARIFPGIGDDDRAARDSARAALLALVFGDSAPGEVQS